MKTEVTTTQSKEEKLLTMTIYDAITNYVNSRNRSILKPSDFYLVSKDIAKDIVKNFK
jgi:hypothetical protein